MNEMIGIMPVAETLNSEWRIPFSLAVAIHVLIFLAVVIAPLIANRQPRMPEIYTVNLFSATEIGPAPAAEQPTAPVQIKDMAAATPKNEPPKTKTEISIPTIPETTSKPQAPAEKPRVVSLKPIKTKKMMRQTAAKDITLSKALQRIQARVEERDARQTADKAIHYAVSQLRNSLHSEKGKKSGKTGQGTAVIDEILKRYYAAVYERIHAYWNLPDLQNWKDSLEAIVILEIRKDGIVTRKFFEKKSDNRFFNQFVDKAIQEASPLPPFPLGLKKKHLEIGLRFRPGELL
ncbi:MAG: TonB C-terminal domain-containing protein [Desulfobulbaceae bacterium]|nr:TonB C-terminal domain-containing protein [Desulfobulbaceae bacterium]